MAWVRVDDSFADHPKVIEAGPMASWLYVCGLTYCARLLTDGFIPDGQVRKLADLDGAKQLAEKLVEVGLWERADDGYRVHDYLEYNPTADKVRADRKAAQERMQRHRSGEVRANIEGSSDEVRVPHAHPTPTPGSTPLPSGADAPERAGKPRDVRAKATVIAEDWEPTPELRAYAAEWGIPDGFVDEVVREFVAYWRQSKGRKIDWGMTFQNRVRDVAPQYQRRARASPAPRRGSDVDYFASVARGEA